MICCAHCGRSARFNAKRELRRCFCGAFDYRSSLAPCRLFEITDWDQRFLKQLRISRDDAVHDALAR